MKVKYYQVLDGGWYTTWSWHLADKFQFRVDMELNNTLSLVVI